MNWMLFAISALIGYVTAQAIYLVWLETNGKRRIAYITGVFAIGAILIVVAWALLRGGEMDNQKRIVIQAYDLDLSVASCEITLVDDRSEGTISRHIVGQVILDIAEINRRDDSLVIECAITDDQWRKLGGDE